MKRLSNKICLGTAKLGLDDYGFSSNELPKDKIKFLEKSYDMGVQSFDTSPRYGNSEIIIGDFLDNIRGQPSISSKIDGLRKDDNHSPRNMIESVKKSIDRMHISKLDVCYLHQNELDIISDPFIHEGFIALKEMGLIQHSGTSIYSFEELDYTVKSGLYDFIQVPVNILDTSYYDRIVDYKSEIKIAVRSIFLQGILFHKQSIKKKVRFNESLLEFLQKLKIFCDSYGVELNTACISYVHALENIEQVIIGTASIYNLKSNIDSSKYVLDKDLSKAIGDLAAGPKSWTNPKNWLE